MDELVAMKHNEESRRERPVIGSRSCAVAMHSLASRDAAGFSRAVDVDGCQCSRFARWSYQEAFDVTISESDGSCNAFE